MNKTLLISLVSVTTSLASAMAGAGDDRNLTLDQYLNQVREGHQGLKASEMTVQGSLLRSKEGGTLLAPTLFANYQYLDDAKTNYLFKLYDKTVVSNYTLGLSQNTSFGLQGRVYYSLTHYNIVGYTAFGPLGTGPVPVYYEGSPTIELTQSLWRNGFGSEARATQELLEASALTTHYSESFRAKSTLSDAEATYWRLALTRQNVAVQKEALDRAQKIYDWNERRSRLHLADESDALQAKAALQARRLQYQAAQDELRSTALLFNETRGLASDQVPEAVQGLEADVMDRMEAPKRAAVRDDVKAAEQSSRAQMANAKISESKNSPTLDLFGSYSRTGRDANTASSTFGNSFNGMMPTTTVGLRFSAPLDLITLSDARKGYSQESDAAELNYQRKLFEQERDWDDLNHRLAEAKRRLKLSREIEGVQRQKLFHEKERLNRGRTTTYQVLIFEQDYSQAQLTRIQAQADVLNLIARMKIFGDQV